MKTMIKSVLLGAALSSLMVSSMSLAHENGTKHEHKAAPAAVTTKEGDKSTAEKPACEHKNADGTCADESSEAHKATHTSKK